VVVLRLGKVVLVLMVIAKLEARRRKKATALRSFCNAGVEAPVRRVLAVLADLSERLESEAARAQLAWMREVIGSNRLYTAVISEGASGDAPMDTETAEWLLSQFAVAPTSPRPAAAGA
jgi:hypothetical protein